MLRTPPRLLLALLLLTAAPVARAATIDDARASTDLYQRMARAFDEKDYLTARDLVERGLQSSPRHPVLLYNAACAYSMLGELDRAADYLYQSVEAGFTDFDHMTRDPDLDPIRSHAVYERIIEIRNEAYARVARKQMQRARETFKGEAYRYETDNNLRMNFVTALDDTSHQEMRELIASQTEHLAEVLFDGPPPYFTLIAVPTPRDAAKLISNDRIGGVYEHDQRRLLARDIGMMLQHELVHLVHYGHMERLNQWHPIWIQEGLAALYETYDVLPNNRHRFKPNQRFNILKRMVDRNAHFRWEQLFEYSGEQFMERSGQTYPQVRSIFRWLAERGKLTAWYETYIEHYDEDKTGALAFEKVFDNELAYVELSWRNWVKSQPMVDLFVGRGEASLGVEALRKASNDGVVIDNVLPRSAAEQAGLERGDVIVSIDGRPTRSFNELVSIIASKDVGEAVRVRVRREGAYLTFAVILAPLRVGLMTPPLLPLPDRTPTGTLALHRHLESSANGNARFAAANHEAG